MHLLSFHRRIVSAGLLLMVIDWIFENCYNGKNPSVFIIKNPIKNPRKPYTSGDFLLYARQESNL